MEQQRIRRQLRRAGVERTHAHRVKVTPEQEARLQEMAAARGVTVARFLVEAALSGGAGAAKTRAELAGELFRLGRLLANLASNVNQIARVANSTGQILPETTAALDAVTRTAERLRAEVEA